MTVGGWTNDRGHGWNRRPDRSRVAEPLIKEARDRQRRRRLWTAALLVAVVGAAVFLLQRYPPFAHAARTPEARAPVAHPYPKPCGLLTDKEVVAALGKDIAIRTPQSGLCTWKSLPLGTFTSAAAQLTLGAVEMSEAQFERFELKVRRTAVPIGDIGVLAFGQPDGNGSLQLDVWERGVALDLSISDVSAPLATEKKLARLALRRI